MDSGYIQNQQYSLQIQIMMAMYIPMMMRSMEYLESSSDPNPFSEIGLMNFAFVIPFIIILLIGLYVFYRQIKYIISLKRASVATQESNLKRSYHMELSMIITSIIFPIVLMIIVFSVLGNISMGISDLEYLDSEEFLTSMLIRLGIIWVVAMLFGIAIIVFKIIAAVSLDKWAETQERNLNHYLMLEMKQGTNYIKIGQIISVIPMISFLGPFLYYYGLGKAGKAMRDYYSQSEPQLADTKSYTSNYATSPSYYGNPKYSATPTTIPPKSSDVFQTFTASKPTQMFCPHCGAPLTESAPSYCPMCGKKI